MTDLLEAKHLTLHYFAVNTEKFHDVKSVRLYSREASYLFRLFVRPKGGGDNVAKVAAHFAWAQKPNMRAMMVSELNEIDLEAIWQLQRVRVGASKAKDDIWVLTVSVPAVQPTLRQQKQSLKRQRSEPQ